MSVTAMSRTFWTEFPPLAYTDKNGKQITIKDTTAKIVLLAIADNADDFGENSYQSFETLAAKASVDRRSVMRVIRALVANNFLKVAGISAYGTNNYSISLDKLGEPPKQRAKTGRPKSGDSEAVSGDPEVKSGDPTSPESSLTHPVTTPQTGSGLTDEEIKQANSMVDAIIENQKKVKYDNRDKIPEPLLQFADVYVELTGQKPTKRVLFQWIGEFNDWISEGLQPNDIRAAYKHATRPDGGFLVGRPGSLTNTAVALKSKHNGSKPAIDHSAVEATKQMIEEKQVVTTGNGIPVDLTQQVKQRLAQAALQRKVK